MLDCKRTKSTAKNVMDEIHKDELVNRLKSTKFSIMIDESTDVSSQKSSCIMVRYFHEAKGIFPLFLLFEIQRQFLYFRFVFFSSSTFLRTKLKA